MVTDKVVYWTNIADYDLDTAEAMYETGRWLYVAFMCHQVVEKMMKAYWTSKREDDPPYTHNHRRIAEGTGLWRKMSDEQHDFVETIMTFNIEARYPRYKDFLSGMLTESTCRNIIDETKKLQQWIREQL